MWLLACLFVAFADDSPDLLSVWRSRTGLDLPADANVRVQPAEGGVALVGRGVSLLLAPAFKDEPLRAALAAQLAPFVAAGSRPSTPQTVACTVATAAATCLEVSVELAPGASMRLLAGQPSGADWTAVCLQRRPEVWGPCVDVLVVPASKGGDGRGE